MTEPEVSRIGLRSIGTLLEPLKHYLKFSKLWTDNVVFRLHCKVTAFILFLSSIIISVGQIFGDPINCIVDSEVSILRNTVPSHFIIFKVCKAFKIKIINQLYTEPITNLSLVNIKSIETSKKWGSPSSLLVIFWLL